MVLDRPRVDTLIHHPYIVDILVKSIVVYNFCYKRYVYDWVTLKVVFNILECIS
jgi:hypothetical protein